MEIAKYVLGNGVTFSILILAVVIATKIAAKGSVDSNEMNRTVGFVLLITGGIVGAFIKAGQLGPTWLYESFAQCAFMFGATVASGFIRAGYEPFIRKND